MIPVDENDAGGGLITAPGQLQFGAMLLGSSTSAGWRSLAGWRDLPDVTVGDSPRPQAHGDYPGSAFGEAILPAFTFLLRGSADDKLADLLTLERYGQVSDVEQWLAVDDGDGVWMRRARVVGRNIPQDKHFRHAPLECSLQFRCADPRRYSLTEKAGAATISGGSGGLTYALTYPLVYGVPATGSLPVSNDGSVATPLVATFVGPLENPGIVAGDWSFGFDLTLATGETLVVDTASGTALLDGSADRLGTLSAASDPLDVCLFPVGSSTVTLTATSGTGQVQITYRDARM